MTYQYYLTEVECYHFETVLPFIKSQGVELSAEFIAAEARLKELDLLLPNLSQSQGDEYRKLYEFQHNYLTEILDSIFGNDLE